MIFLGVMKQVKDNRSSVSLPFFKSNLLACPLNSSFKIYPQTYYLLCPGYCYFWPTFLQKLPPLTLCFHSCSLTIFSPKSSLLKTKPFHALLETSQNKIQIYYKGLQSLMWCAAWLPLHLHFPLFLPASHCSNNTNFLCNR